jgi:DNA-binding NtrC family response regulator
MLKKKNALVVEDDLFLRPLLGPIIRAALPGAQICWVQTAEEAIDLLKLGEFDLVIADIYLKGKTTGLQLWKDVDSMMPEIPFVFMSGLAYSEFVKAVGRDKVAPPFLEKPLNVNNCKELLQAVMKSGQS